LPEIIPCISGFAYRSDSGHGTRKKDHPNRSDVPRKNAAAETAHQVDHEKAQPIVERLTFAIFENSHPSRTAPARAATGPDGSGWICAG
jgi:hypothetical protein